MKKKILVIALSCLMLISAMGVVSAFAADNESTPELTVYKHNLSFSETIYIMYAVDAQNADKNDVELLLWTSPQSEYTADNAETKLSSAGTTTVDGKNCLVFEYRELAARQMTDYVYARAHVSQDGEDYYSEVSKYSILTYAYSKLGKIDPASATTNEKLKTLLTNMLTYGASAQEYFGYKTDTLASDNFSYITVNGGTLPDGFTTGLYKTGTAVTLTAPAPAEDYQFSHWKNGAGEKVGSTSTLELTVGSANDTFTPVCVEKPYAIAVINGTLPDGSSNGMYTPGTVLTLTANTAGTGYEFSHWEDGAGQTVGEETTLEITVGKAAAFYIAVYTETKESLAFTSNGDGTCYVSGIGTVTGTDIVIPSVSPDGDKVTGIGNSAFSNKTITSVVIPDGVTSIGTQAFRGCTGLTSITVDSNNTVYHSAGNCIIETESKTLIAGCNNSVIPTDDSVTSIGSFAFQGCTGLTSITIPDSVTSIGSSAFSGCTGLTSITIPDSVTSIGDWAFYKCTGLTSITIPDSVTSIDDYAFSSCTGLTSVTIGNGVTKIGQYAFSGCSKLNHVVLGGKLKDISYYAFENCTSITSITLPSSVASIGNYAFSGCTGFTGFTVPDSVTSIGKGAFKGCNGLVSITVPFAGSAMSSVDNYYDYFSYIFGSNDSESAYYVPDSLKTVTITKDSTIPLDAFYGCDTITKIVLPDSVTSIESYAFYGCSSLTSINIPSSVTSIGNSAFRGCSSLTSINIPSSVTSIGDLAFSGCSSLTSINIPSSVTSIGDSAFSGCSSLKYNQYNNAYYVGNSSNLYLALVKAKDTSITTCTINSKTKIICGSAFVYCSELTSITIPNSVTSIGDSAFRGCSSIRSVSIGSGVTSIGTCAFEWCSSLTSITIPDSVTSIGWFAFGSCSSLTSVTIGNGVTIIDDNAFSGCTSLTYATFKNPNGWNAGGISLSGRLSDPATVATYLTSTYKIYTWRRT